MTKKQQGKSAKGPGGGQRQMHVRVKTAAKRTTSSQRWLQRQAGKAAMGATRAQSQAWEDPGIPQGIQNWEGSKITAEVLNNNNLGSSATTIPSAKPEGATLRKW